MPTATKKTKKTKTTKHKAPQRKPSALLARALALFGPKGEFWVKGYQEIAGGSRFIRSKTDRHIINTVYLDGNIIAPWHDKRKLGTAAADMFCSYGAIQRINTNRMDEAINYLVAATEIDQGNLAPLAANAKPEYRSSSAIFSYNDAEETKWRDVKRWFTKAITLAKERGD